MRREPVDEFPGPGSVGVATAGPLAGCLVRILEYANQGDDKQWILLHRQPDRLEGGTLGVDGGDDLAGNTEQMLTLAEQVLAVRWLPPDVAELIIKRYSFAP